MRKHYNIIRFIALIVCCVCSSCEDFFDPENNDNVRGSDFASSREDLNAGLWEFIPSCRKRYINSYCGGLPGPTW